MITSGNVPNSSDVLPFLLVYLDPVRFVWRDSFLRESGPTQFEIRFGLCGFSSVVLIGDKIRISEMLLEISSCIHGVHVMFIIF